MAQATICPHSAPGQIILPDRPTPCLMCGALLQADANATGVAANYPGSAASEATITTDVNAAVPAPEF